jgi:hypothetical protein
MMPEEDDCVVCGKWPEKDRWALREMLDSLPMFEQVCDACLMAWWALATSGRHRSHPPTLLVGPALKK